MGLVEILEPHDRAYFTASLIDIDETGKRNLVRWVPLRPRRLRLTVPAGNAPLAGAPRNLLQKLCGAGSGSCTAGRPACQ